MNYDERNLTGKYSKRYMMSDVNEKIYSIPPHLNNIYSKISDNKDEGSTGQIEYSKKYPIPVHDCCWHVNCEHNSGCIKSGTEKVWMIGQYPPEYKLFYTIGTMRSGKSTYAKQWQEEGKKRVVLSGDSFRKGVHGQIYIGEAEFFVFACMDAAARALLSEGYTVLIDETSSTLNSIERYLRINIDAQPIWIDTSKETCIERAKVLKQEYLIPAIKRVSKQIEELKEDFDNKIYKIKNKIIERQKTDYIPKIHPSGI